MPMQRMIAAASVVMAAGAPSAMALPAKLTDAVHSFATTVQKMHITVKPVGFGLALAAPRQKTCLDVAVMSAAPVCAVPVLTTHVCLIAARVNFQLVKTALLTRGCARFPVDSAGVWLVHTAMMMRNK